MHHIVSRGPLGWTRADGYRLAKANLHGAGEFANTYRQYRYCSPGKEANQMIKAAFGLPKPARRALSSLWKYTECFPLGRPFQPAVNGRGTTGRVAWR